MNNYNSYCFFFCWCPSSVHILFSSASIAPFSALKKCTKRSMEQTKTITKTEAKQSSILKWVEEKKYEKKPEGKIISIENKSWRCAIAWKIKSFEWNGHKIDDIHTHTHTHVKHSPAHWHTHQIHKTYETVFKWTLYEINNIFHLSIISPNELLLLLLPFFYFIRVSCFVRFLPYVLHCFSFYCVFSIFSNIIIFITFWLFYSHTTHSSRRASDQRQKLKEKKEQHNKMKKNMNYNNNNNIDKRKKEEEEETIGKVLAICLFPLKPTVQLFQTFSSLHTHTFFCCFAKLIHRAHTQALSYMEWLT